MTWTGDWLPPLTPEPTEESSRDSDLGTDRAEPELMEPEPVKIFDNNLQKCLALSADKAMTIS